MTATIEGEVEYELSPATLRLRKASRSMVRNAFLNAAAEAISPDEVAQAFRDALDIAKNKRDPKAMVMVLELLLNYSIGRPSPFEERDALDIDRILQRVTIDTVNRFNILTAAPAPFIEDNINATGESFTLPHHPAEIP